MVFNLLKNFFIFLKNKITNVKILLTIMFSSLIVLELAKFLNINLDYLYYFALTPAVWLVYTAYDKYIVPIITRIIVKFFNLNKFHNYIPSIITIFTRLFILYNGGMGYYICTYFTYFIETYDISLIPIFNSINKNIFETIYNSKLFNSIFETIYNSKIFYSVNNNIINMFNNINNIIIEIIHNLNLFINENKNIINIFKNINNNIIEIMYNINISINNIFNNVFNNTNSLYLIIDKDIIINIINELFKNKLYLNGFDDYVYNDFNIKIVMYHTGTPEDIETSKSNPGNGSRSASVSSNQESQPVADIISNNPIHSPSAPYTNENLIKWGINELDFAKIKFDDIIAPFKDPNTNVPIEILRGDKHNIAHRSVLVYLNKTFTMSRIEIDESKVFSLYNKEIKKYYDPVHGIWWNGSTGRWIDSDLYYIRGDIKVDLAFDYRIKTAKNKFTILFMNRSLKDLSFDENIKTLLKEITEWNIVHLNAIEYIRPDNSYKFTSREAGRSYMLNLNESTVKAYAQKLWCVNRPINLFDTTVSKLLWEKSQLGIGTPERENISILIDRIIALKCQTLYLNKNLSNYYLLLDKDYKWLQSSKVYMPELEKRLNSMIKKPS